jgi:hypothetical protein
MALKQKTALIGSRYGRRDRKPKSSLVAVVFENYFLTVWFLDSLVFGQAIA